MTSSLLKKTIVAFVALAVLASGTAFAQTLFDRWDTVLGYRTDVWRVWVPQGSGRVVVDGQTRTDIDLEVIDEATGRLLAMDDDRTSYCIGDFYKARAGYITIRVANLGRFSNTYNVYIQ